MLQQHPYYGGPGDNGVNPLLQPDVLRQREDLIVKAGAVIGPDGADPPLHRQRAEHACPYRQISALGVSPQPQLHAGILAGHGLRIFHGLFLGWDFPHAAEIEVLLPSCQRVVRSPKREVQRPIAADNGQRRELLCLLRVQMIHKAAELHIPEPGCRRHAAQHLRDLIWHQHAHIDGSALSFCKVGRSRFAQRHRRTRARFGNDAAEIHKRKLRQNQIIHFVEGISGKGQIAAPIQIVQEICHSCPPCRYLNGIRVLILPVFPLCYK